MPFAPDVAIDLSTRVPKAPAAITASVTNVPAEGSIRALSVQFPKAFGYNEAAGTIDRCSPAEEEARDCPGSSRIGIATAQSIVPAEGEVFLSDDFRLITFAEALGGAIQLKIVADIVVAPSGGFGIDFTGFPDLPINEIKLELFEGDRALLKNPGTCGTFTIPTQFTSFADETVNVDPAVEIEGCTAPRITGVRVRGSDAVRVRWETAAPTTLVRLERRRGGSFKRLTERRVATTSTRFAGLRKGRYRVRLTPDGGRPVTRTFTR